MLKSVRIEAGLGDPPSDYTNNAAEAGNFILKYGLKFKPTKPYKFVSNVKEIINNQFRNEERAVFGKGPYKVRPEFSHLIPNELKWVKMTPTQRMKVIQKFLETGMEGLTLEDLPGNPKSEEQNAEPATRIPLSAKNSGIKTIPFPILESMFQKAEQLLAIPGYVIPQPASTTGSYIVAGNGNKIHIVTPGKGGSWSCDRQCINRSTKLCEHIIAVTVRNGVFEDMIKWFNRSKFGPSVTEMALQGGPKGAGKKPSQRKKTNRKKQDVTEYVDIHGNADNAPKGILQAQISPDDNPIPAHQLQTGIQSQFQQQITQHLQPQMQGNCRFLLSLCNSNQTKDLSAHRSTVCHHCSPLSFHLVYMG